MAALKPYTAEPRHREWFWAGQAVILGIIALISWGFLFIAAGGMFAVGVFRAPWFKDETSDQRLVFKGLIATVIFFALFVVWSQVPPPRTLEQINDLLSRLSTTATIQLLAPATPTPTRSALASVPTPTAIATPTASPSSPVLTPDAPTQPLSLRYQFLNYSSIIKTTPQSDLFYPPGELSARIEARLVFIDDPHLRQKQLVIYIPGIRGTGNTYSACMFAIAKSEQWLKQIEKQEAGNAEFAGAHGFILRSKVVIFHESPLFNLRADGLRRQGHKLFGPEVQMETP